MGRPKKTDKRNKRGNGEGTIYQRKDGTWCAQITTGIDPKKGTPIRKTVYGKKRDDVKNKLIEIQNQLRTRTYGDPGKLTLGEWLDTWLYDYMKNSLRQTTFESYEVQIEKHIKPAIGDIKLKDLDSDDLQAFYNAKLEGGRADKKKNEKGEMVQREGGLSPKSVRYIHGVIYRALQYAKSKKKPALLSDNVAEGVILPRDPKKEMKILPREDLKVFLETAKSYRYYAAYFLALATGLRRGELLALRWRDVDFKAGTINITRHLVRVKNGLIFQEPKTEKSKRTVEVSAEAMMVLKAHKVKQAAEKLAAGESYEGADNEKDRLVFCTALGNPVQPRSFVRDFHGCLKRAGLEKIRFHDIRHTYATLTLENGATLNAVQEQLGHHSPAFTAEQYGHGTKRMKQEAANAMGDILKEAANSSVIPIAQVKK